jgi:hypothetical protein
MEEQRPASDPESGRRVGDRRTGLVRRAQARGTQDRRQGDRRVVAVAVFAAGAMLFGGTAPASADVYTHKNARGVFEATDRGDQEGFKLAFRSKGVVIHSAAFRAAPPRAAAFEGLITEAAAIEGISADLVRAVIHTESAFDAFAVSSTGARGLMQLMPDAARRFGVADPFDARQNILGGTRYLRVLLKQFGGDVTLATAAYNAGEGTVARYRGVPPYRETINYVRRIQALLAGPQTQAPVAMMASYTPGDTRDAAPAAMARTTSAPAKRTASMTAPARRGPRILYKWQGRDGVLHVAQTPPSDGAPYNTIVLAD